MSQPQPPRTRQSAPPAKPAPRNARDKIPPGGPILESVQHGQPPPSERGTEDNTERSKGDPNPPQVGSDIRHGDHEPGKGQSGDPHGHGIDAPRASGRTGEHSAKLAPPPPNPRGVRK